MRGRRVPDYSKDPVFQAAVVAAEAGIEHLAQAKIRDAKALIDRRHGRNNLQGHYNALVPFSVLLLRLNPSLAGLIRAQTSLAQEMTARSAEARDIAIWAPVQAASSRLISKDPAGVLGDMLSGGPLRVRDAARYLSTRYGGAQTSGSGGDTVLKRTLKLVSHMFEA